ncbi:alpha/beta fold hydrolase [Lyngbya confervoides]|uniref:Alpha/beta fold hydrolase n=1 Tax=Lyngbya confervoides BDU141951 TaxID=1574623 RepID=A0ABD4T036_9CYAN|nr:alpha/beta fold hydrolase [Lyngbya confervoides]MCM1981808.1 alpha/beta fold hydrolase [Lyngbya confervoides BDU141951]
MTSSLRPAPDSQYWIWQGHSIHYVQQGQKGPCLLLVHGFGASTDHWRKNIEVLSRSCRVWAIDLLGFGRSQKPRVGYTAQLWVDQLRQFCQEIVGEPIYVVGNSLGAYVALCLGVDHADQVEGLVLINCAGPFKSAAEAIQSTRQRSVRRRLFQLPGVIPLMSFLAFRYFRRRSQIRKTLLRVYRDPAAVTDRLVEEIYQPAFDPGAFGVFASVFQSPPGRTLDDLLGSLSVPLLLLWGTADPWMDVEKGRKCQRLYPQADLELVEAGHCPHDECPDQVNSVLQQWIVQQEAPPVPREPTVSGPFT